MEREIRAAVQKAQGWGTDIFEFGEAIHRKYPMVWADLEKRWAEEFPYVELRIEVDAKLRRIGLSTKQIDPFFALNFDPLG
ncbi:MAG: hypothetical protein H5U02_08605 [Clostridia bacterium]|nr:hypothetical protein [Clostridia bacterium]